jgi:hypothetical protein
MLVLQGGGWSQMNLQLLGHCCWQQQVAQWRWQAAQQAQSQLVQGE